MADPEPSSTSSASDCPKPEDDKDIAIEGLQHLINGKRHLLLHDYSSAVSSLQEACQLFDQKYGIGADECSDAYLQYGTALLELARLETGVIDGVVHSKVADMTDTEDDGEDESGDDAEEDGDGDDEQNQDEEAEVTKEEGKKTDTEEDIELSDEDKKKRETDAIVTPTVEPNANIDQSSVANSAINLTQSLDICEPSTSKADNPNDEEDAEENEASSIEVAWEVLALAKAVFMRSIEKEGMKLKLAETLQKLGEISIEWENNQNAIEILTECLSLRKEILPDDDRLIAETYYHLGLAFSFSNQCDGANDCFRSAIQVIETRIANQRKKISSASSDQRDMVEAAEREIAQLEDLLPEMRAKIEDSQDQMDIARKALADEEIERMKEDAAAVKSQEVKEKPINDISHLIKRKRQNSGSESSPQKVPCTNGHNVHTAARSEPIANTENITEENKV